MSYSELIKDFKEIRDYMREFYVYGFKSREMIGKKSTRTYDNVRRRVESWLGDSMCFSRTANGKAQYITIDTRKVSANPLYHAFKTKSFTDNDLMLHFILLDILDEDTWMSSSEISDVFYQEYIGRLEKELEIEPSIIRIKLNEYVKEGILECKKTGRNNCYKKMPNRISVEEWKEAISFYSEAGTLGVIGSCLLDNRALKQSGQHTSKYRFKHHYLVHVLESQVLYQVFEAMNCHKNVRIFVAGRQAEKQSEFEIYPVKVYESTQNGRIYVLGYETKRENFRFFRLDNIVTVKVLKEQEQAEQIDKKYQAVLPYLWGVSMNNKRTEHLEMTLLLKERDAHILTRLHREKRNGRIVELEGNRYRYETDVFDAMELMPWIRSFIGRIEKLECSNKAVEQIFYDDLEEMKKIYLGSDDSDF